MYIQSTYVEFIYAHIHIHREIFIKINNNINKVVLSTCSNEKFTRWREAAKTNENNSELRTEN